MNTLNEYGVTTEQFISGINADIKALAEKLLKFHVILGSADDVKDVIGDDHEDTMALMARAINLYHCCVNLAGEIDKNVARKRNLREVSLAFERVESNAKKAKKGAKKGEVK